MLKKLLIEELTRSDENFIKSEIDDRIDDSLDSTEYEDRVREITTEVIEDLFKVLWQRRSSWRGGIK